MTHVCPENTHLLTHNLNHNLNHNFCNGHKPVVRVLLESGAQN